MPDDRQPRRPLSGQAVCLIRTSPHYRHDAVLSGLQSIGLRAETVTPARWQAGDVLVIWNRYGRFAAVADRCEAAGGVVIVAENGYLGRDGEGRQLYALALDHHKGPGRWFPQADRSRWRRLRLQIRPWRPGGQWVLLAPERGIGPPDHAMPRDWPGRAEAVLRRISDKPVRVRRHPGNHAPERSLSEDLGGAAAVITWGSTAGLEALLAGVPVYHAMPRWIGAPCAQHWDCSSTLPAPNLPDRSELFASIAWAQWTVEEIADGAPFRHLLFDVG